jgi:hypothetical protein
MFNGELCLDGDRINPLVERTKDRESLTRRWEAATEMNRAYLAAVLAK